MKDIEDLINEIKDAEKIAKKDIKFIYDFLCVPFRCWGSEVFRVHLGHYKPAKRATHAVPYSVLFYP